MDNKENINFIFQLNNKDRSSYYFLLFIVSGISSIGIALWLLVSNQNIGLIITIASAILFFFLFSKLKPSYFEMLLTEKEILVNFYSLANISRNYQSIELPINKLIDFRIKKSLGGIKKYLILSVNSKYGIADYPSISISILTKKEIALIYHVLNEIKKNNIKT